MTIDRTEVLAQGPSDAELITATRSGDAAAYGQLYARHVFAARRLARTLANSNADADDLVAEVFAKMLDKFKTGGGPDAAFRTYLLTSVRNTFYDRLRRNQKVTVTDDVAKHDPGVPFVDTAVEGLERSLAARAFAKLPERWQVVLWHTEVEGESAAEVAPLLGLTPNGVSALAYRARERLRQAYLQEHLTDTAGSDCGWTIERLGAHVRGGLANRETGKVKAHLSDCDRCRALFSELSEVNSGLRGVLAPLVLGGSAAAYLTAGSKGGLSLISFWEMTRQAVSTRAGQVAMAGGGVAAATAVTLALAPHSTPVGDPADAVTQPKTSITEPSTGSTNGPSPSATTGTGPADPGASASASASPSTPGSPGPTPTGDAGVPGQQQTEPAPAPGAPSTGAPLPADKPGRADVSANLDPARPLARGRSSVLVLTMTNNGRSDGTGGGGAEAKPNGPATAKITATFSLPRGVTLGSGSPGDKWSCSATSGGAVCSRPSLPAGRSTTARVPVTVAADAAAGTPSATLTSTNIGTKTVSASSGVVGSASETTASATSMEATTQRHGRSSHRNN
jgi:RNA polymerase sigma factor (sigma-70 family)